MELTHPRSPEEKRCPRCGETKRTEEFTRNRSSKDGLGAYCRPCHTLVIREHKERRYGSEQNFLLQLRYGVDQAQVQRLVKKQGGTCAICRKRPAKHVDHCHETGKVRQIMCFYCNRGLGKFKDSPLRMQKAIQYLSGSKMP